MSDDMTDDIKNDIKTDNVPNNQPANRSSLPIILVTALLILLFIVSGLAYTQISQKNNTLIKKIQMMETRLTTSSHDVENLRTTIDGLKQLKTEIDVQITNNKIEQDKLKTLINEWQSLSQASVTKRYLELTDLDKKLDQLSLPTPDTITIKSPSSTQPIASWRNVLDQTLAALSKVVVVKKTTAKGSPLVMPDEKLFLYQNLHAKLENAKWAVLHKNQVVYQTSLQEVVTWINTYFAINTPISKSITDQLTTLMTMNVDVNADANLNLPQ